MTIENAATALLDCRHGASISYDEDVKRCPH